MANQNRHLNFIRVAAGSLIFLSILPYAGAFVWSEAIILTAIFMLGAVVALGRRSEPDAETRSLLAPIFAVAFYSFLQGASALLTADKTNLFSAALPVGFDLAASFWCALKFLALAVFLKTLLDAFRGDARFLIWSLIVAGNLHAALGIVRFLLQAGFPDFFHWFIFPELRPEIGFGTFINQNHFAFLMLMNLGLTCAAGAFGGLSKPTRWLLSAGSLLTWTAIILTASRGGIISSFVVVAVLIFSPLAGFTRNKQRDKNDDFRSVVFSLGNKLAVTVALAMLLIVGVALIGQDRVAQRFIEIPKQLESAENSESYRRIDVWQATLKMIAENRLYGVGFGGFRYAVAQHIDISGAIVPYQAHNDYLELAASGGLIAVIGGVWFLGRIFLLMKKRFGSPAGQFENAARVGVVAAFAGIAFHSFFDFSLQFIGNWLFCAALVAVAVCPGKAEKRERIEPTTTGFSLTKPILANTFSALAVLGLCFICLLFGYSRLENALAENNSDHTFAENAAPKILFDANFYETKAAISRNYADLAETAAENLTSAIRYRPKDYVLWLNLATLRAAKNQSQAAEEAFLQAIRLAPLYGEPHFAYGKFLVMNGRKTEGFKELHFSFERSPQLFDAVLKLAWRETGGSAEETIRLLTTLDAPEKSKLADFLLNNQRYAAAAELICADETLNARQRAELITKLFEKRQYLNAFKVDRRNCGGKPGGEKLLADGDFETPAVQQGFGFGWRVADLPDSINFLLDRESAADGQHSLSFIFDGDSDPGLPLISQTIVVEKNQQYEFSFAYRAERITSGGLPVVQLIFRQAEAPDKLFKEIKLPVDGSSDWSRSSILIRTDKQAEALEIRITRQPCRQSLCPIFGRLWIDNFILNKK